MAIQDQTTEASRSYIYAEDGTLLGYLAYVDTPGDVIEMSGRYFERAGTFYEEDGLTLGFDYWETDSPPVHMDVIQICATCGLNSSLVWWKCCLRHVTEDGQDVICQACVENFHPGDPEFAR